jgi:hypothetical protein
LRGYGLVDVTNVGTLTCVHNNSCCSAVDNSCTLARCELA